MNNNTSTTQGVCPDGWHIPSAYKFVDLFNYVKSIPEYICDGTSTNFAKALTSNSGWTISDITCAIGNNQSINNSTGFNALPAGYGSNGVFANNGSNAYFFSSTSGTPKSATNYNTGYNITLFNAGGNSRALGLSIRCIKNP